MAVYEGARPRLGIALPWLRGEPGSRPDSVPSSRRPAAARCQEQEARALLIGVPEETTMRLGAVLAGDLVHPRTLGRGLRPCLTNPGNYT